MSETCFNSYVKTFENLLGNEPDLELEITEALITNLNDTINGKFMNCQAQGQGQAGPTSNVKSQS